MDLTEYIILFGCVVILGAGLPGLGDASLIAAGTLAGEGRLNVGVVLATATVAWMVGSVAWYWIGLRGGRGLLGHPGPLGKAATCCWPRATGFSAVMISPRRRPCPPSCRGFSAGLSRSSSWVRWPLASAGSGCTWGFLFGEEVAKHIGDAGSKVIVGVVVAVAIALGLRAIWSKRCSTGFSSGA